MQPAGSVSRSSSKETLCPPPKRPFLLTAEGVITNAVTREKMEMQGLGKEGGTALQMHKSSSGWFKDYVTCSL